MTSGPNIPKNLTPEELKRLADLSADLPGLMRYPHHAGSAMIQPTEEGVLKQRNLETMHQQAGATMNILMDFMQLAMKHAGDLKDRVEISHEIYDAKISFDPIIGHHYFLYMRKSGEKFLSMVEPAAWSKNNRLKCHSEVKLLADRTWQVISRHED